MKKGRSSFRIELAQGVRIICENRGKFIAVAFANKSKECRQLTHVILSMIYLLVQYCLLTAVCGYLVIYFASKDVSLHVKVWSLITWVLNFGLALLVPEDVYQSLHTQRDEKAIEGLGFQYLLLYWSVYLLTWTIIPVLQEWEDAGELKSMDRLRRSLKVNGIFYLWLIVGAVVALIALIMLNAGGDMGLITFLKCLATIWGMLLLMMLMGYSLIEIPKTLWLHAKPTDLLQYLYRRIAESDTQLRDAQTQFRNAAIYVHISRTKTNDPLILEYCNASEAMIPSAMRFDVRPSQIKSLQTLGYLKEYPFGLPSSIEHNRLMKRHIARCQRQQYELLSYIKQAIFYEDVQESVEKGTPFRSVLTTNTTKFKQFWHCKARFIVHRIAAVVVGAGSIVLLVSQTQVFLTSDQTLLGHILSLQSLQAARLATFVVIAFVVWMANYALFRLKLANLYGLYRRGSDGASLMFATVNFSRIGVAIVLNFFDMLKMQNSIYSSVMGAPKMGLLGQWVLKGLPGVLWLIALSHCFGFWGWLARQLGMEDSYAFASHDRKGGDILPTPERVRQKRRQLEHNHSKAILQFRELSEM